jgi:hypothetical protein
MDLYLISGIVSDLVISNSFRYVLYSIQEIRLIDHGPRNPFPTKENEGFTFVNDGDSDQEPSGHFGCTVGSETVTGWFDKVEFLNGQYIDFVVRKDFRREFTLAARDPVRRLYWTAAFQTRGHIAARRARVHQALKVSAWVTAACLVVSFFSGWESGPPMLFMTLFVAVAWFVLTFMFCWLTSRMPDCEMYEATEVFDILGFADPANVNLPKTHRRAEKRYAIESGKACEWWGGIMRFRYDPSALRHDAGRKLLGN